MEVIFKDPHIEELIRDQRMLVQKYGAFVAKQVQQRVAEILACYHLLMLKELPNGLHPLKRKRKGQFAVDLGHAYRLVFEPANQPISRRPDGTIIWERVNMIRILEIVDYHDERT
jgi:proteic killer suppression protein